ncbi:MAG: oligosaccharide repeat unit polymerase [Gammaproteobacteria bacterium]|nr:oligosaccharide repeat unit polymerase [Gammaproteobacteria bacterium]MCF6337245.1 oligosaccharide repeat unit polymerase [Gammaproteobacteria bacterium]
MGRVEAIVNRSTNSVDGLTFALGGGFLVLLCFIVILYSNGAALSLRVVFPLVTIFFTSVSLFYILMAGSRNIFEPAVPATAMLGVLFGIRPIVMIVVGDVDYYLFVPISEHLTEAFFIGMLGTLAFLFGYHIKLGVNKWPVNMGKQLVPKYDSNKKRLHIYIAAISLVALILFFVYLSAGGAPWELLQMMASGRSTALVDKVAINSEYLSVAPILSACAAILMIADSRSESLTGYKKIIVLFLILFPVMVFMLMGVRRFIIPSILIPIVVYYFIRNKRPSIKMVVVIAPVILVLISAIPYMRTEGARSQAGGLTNFFEFAIKEHRELLSNILLKHDTEMVSILSVEVGVLNEMDDFYFGRATVGDLLIAPIPSSLFPWKPSTARDLMLVDAFGSKCNATEGGLCPDFSILGTFYQDFWYFGVVGGMFFLGVGSRWLWVKYRRDPSSMLNIISVSCWAVFIPIIIRAGFMPAFAWFLYFLIPCVVGVFLSRKRRQRMSFNELEDNNTG